MFITQATAFQSNQFRRIFWTVKRVFRNAVPLHVYIKSFCDDWGFVMGLKSWELRLIQEDFKEVDRKISEEIRGRLRYLNGRTYLSSLAIPSEEEEKLMKPARDITDREALEKKSREEELASLNWVFR